VLKRPVAPVKIEGFLSPELKKPESGRSIVLPPGPIAVFCRDGLSSYFSSAFCSTLGSFFS
jgi:hypothetical protein